ncbi:hypothetical protein P7F88_07075 [Vibrio hannami]|uniref:hypothetical protein n=1 Tax=Vibrio hannami TaxID=2717094 RepID=UPI002410859F|nr:hypothetical protein [Vibrio hannami]MDG3085869.1 hypothetical protein [Vibrio hannami]
MTRIIPIRDYSLAALVGYTFVSPITTMVVSELESSSESLDIAEAKIISQLGLNIEPKQDYVSKKQSSDASEKKAYQQLHQVAQVAAAIMKETHTNFSNDSSAEQGISTEEKLDWIADKVADRLETIASEIIETDDVNATASSFVVSLGSEIELDVTSAKSEIEVKRELQLASASELLDIVTSQGIYSYSAWHNDSYLRAFYNNFKLATSSNVNNAYEEAGVEYQYDGTTPWKVRTDEGSNITLTPDGWKNLRDDFFIEVNNITGEVTLTHPTYSNIIERFTANKVSLQNKPIDDVLNAADFRAAKWADFVTANTTFSNSESYGYRMEFIELYDRYELWQHSCEANELRDGVCYQTWLSNDVYGYALTLNDLISQTAASSASQAKGPNVAWYNKASGAQGYVFAEMVNDSRKSVNFYVVSNDEQGNSNSQNGELVATGNWEIRQVNSETIYVVFLPSAVRFYSDDNDTARIFAVHDNADGVSVVHQGKFQPKFTVEEQEMVFNKSAHDEVLAVFDSSKFCSVQAATKHGNPSQASVECP